MRKTRGFKPGQKLVNNPDGYDFLQHSLSPHCKSKTISKICDWGRNLKRGAKMLCWREPLEAKPVAAVPKEHLVVYAGEKDGCSHRVLVPIIYFNRFEHFSISGGTSMGF
ncbi:hypothetical protein NE237_027242 [Protea cynaroides]|uniref:Uncharacterized protein n=1 Tax=Protea cynaroides TaxID=273540 RepID=A0A9Q0GQ43_9MAGN|nr:hypothetical protein NE237_027242 [Protea cynaroides]